MIRKVYAEGNYLYYDVVLKNRAFVGTVYKYDDGSTEILDDEDSRVVKYSFRIDKKFKKVEYSDYCKKLLGKMKSDIESGVFSNYYIIPYKKLYGFPVSSFLGLIEDYLELDCVKRSGVEVVYKLPENIDSSVVDKLFDYKEMTWYLSSIYFYTRLCRER